MGGKKKKKKSSKDPWSIPQRLLPRGPMSDITNTSMLQDINNLKNCIFHLL